MKRDIWDRSFSPSEIPRYPCPHCFQFSLKLSGKVLFDEPEYSKKNHSHEEFEPEWVTERVSLQLKCDASDCKEIVNVIGDMTWAYDYDAEGHSGEVQVVKPAAFFPAPPMIDIPSDTPTKAKIAAEQAFAVCWADTGSAANRIRASVELALDGLNVPRTGISKKTGKTVDLDLNGRIQWLEKQSGVKKDHASTFEALRVAGNAGSHGANDVSWADFLDCLFLYEAALEDLFGSKSKLLANAKARLLKLKKPKQKNFGEGE